tara:strand:+ start:1234 stop:1908 length:675 start_codon:yes stop_codon:yes gene_type:complete
MKIKQFKSIEQLENSLVTDIVKIITDSIENYGDARILLSGGSTPINLYSTLSQQNINWSKVKIGLVDERFVNNDSDFSNEKLIRKNLLKNYAKDALFFEMVYSTDNEKLNLELVNDKYSSFMKRLDLTILGMGSDGHTASIFPNDLESERIMNTKNIGIYSTKAPKFPFNRITCSKEIIGNSNDIFLFITGKTKFNIFKNSIKTNVPISYFIKEYENMETYYTE